MAKLGYTRYLAFKRVAGFEQCAMGPCAFLPRQWGNLFFFSDEFYSVAEPIIVGQLGRAEAALVDQWIAVATDREAKETVIRQQIDKEQTRLEQIATLDRICAERLVVIETLDAEVTRLRG